MSAAAAAQPEWAARPPRDRSEVLRECWRLIHVHADELARLLVSEQGKPLAEAHGELDYAAEFFRWNAEETVRIGGRLAPTPSGVNRVLVTHHPVGVVVMVTPWNFPAAMITRKVAPALGAGNAVVIKPAAETPLTALYLGELMTRAGVPAGVVNIVPSNRPGDWFDAAIAHPATRMISFTGSTRVGRELLAKGSARVLKSTMELGGNAPFVVLEGADLDVAIDGAMYAKTRHTGQTCVAANRFFVHQSLAGEFTDRLAGAMAALRVGTGLEPDVAVRPGDQRRRRRSPRPHGEGSDRRGRAARDRRLASAVATASSSNPPCVTDVPPDAAILDQELFGPVAPIVTFSDVDEMVERANATEMGLAGYVFGPELGRGLAVAERLQVGMVGLNRGYASDPSAPFGGMKQSGLGREGGLEGIYDFCETQFVATGW